MTLTFDAEEAVPLGHEPVYLDKALIGQTTSCAFGHRVGRPVALAHVSTLPAAGARVDVDIARTLHSATVTYGAVFDPQGLRMRPG